MPTGSSVGKIELNTPVFFTYVQEDMQQVEALMRCQGADCQPDLRAALEHLLEAGGKRIRPTLGLLTGRMLGAPHQRLITLGAAVELLHTATLVHDDLIDGSLLRRGIQTLNAQWSPPATVLTGDFIFARAAKLAAETDHLPLMKLFAETLAVIVNGELTQLFAARGVASRENYYKRIYAKTASLIEMTTCAAAMISPVEPPVVEAMRQFGYHLGMAFQIVDDVLDFTGEQSEVGKPVGSDLLQGLVTLPTLYYVEAHRDQVEVQALLDGRYLQEREKMEALVQAIRDSDATNFALNEARGYIEKALLRLSAIPERLERQALEELAQYIVNRRM
jgi:geranylgeranyl pyrophosphate synthase